MRHYIGEPNSSIEEVRKYIDYYNTRRPHRFLNYKSPSEVEAAYYASLKA